MFRFIIHLTVYNFEYEATSTVGASSSVTRRVLSEIVYVIYYEVWAVFILEYELKG